MTRPIILDLTPGAQAAATLLAALQLPAHVRVAGVLFSGAGTEVGAAMAHARDMLDQNGLADVGIYAGVPGPMVPSHGAGRALPAGHDGLGAAQLVQAIRACPPDSVTVCCSGPLSTLALAMVQAPDLAAHLHGVVMAGGAFHVPGNVTTVAERNIAADPEAASVVLGMDVPLTLVPLDCTSRFVADAVWMEPLAAMGHDPASVAGRVHADLVAARMGRGGGNGADLALAAAAPLLALVAPALFSGHLAHVAVECCGTFTRGMTVIQLPQRSGGQPNALVLERMSVDAARGVLRDLLLAAVK
ncbi:nucleoside hydrolase [Komagataeibacter sucrofermentans]|uniref:Nucleoside hydrolase n=1 Tax=Komagataeibacter sucrofermentans TaxID=1053551 RepID=A0A318QQF9_9PROT|nr:nucleoside hydrolase [Komagataeibacter sucrofermentans]PYD79542.1 nucleoside hydrolase [Komagataeibacter sucrofermentans]GBQ46688.1 inosine-uridine preferring nucleoside hydrolase [Komagataeibacter sucrofermentans DSM 15973]